MKTRLNLTKYEIASSQMFKCITKNVLYQYYRPHVHVNSTPRFVCAERSSPCLKRIENTCDSGDRKVKCHGVCVHVQLLHANIPDILNVLSCIFNAAMRRGCCVTSREKSERATCYSFLKSCLTFPISFFPDSIYHNYLLLF